MSCWRASRGLGACVEDPVLLCLPDVRQSEGHDCGEGAVRCLLEFHGIMAAVRLATRTHGTDPVQIESAFRNLAFGVTAGEMTVEDLRHFCDHGRPVIVLVHWSGGSDSHYIVVRGVSRNTVYFHDPLTGPGKASRAEFEAAWHAEGRVGTYHRWGISPWRTTK